MCVRGSNHQSLGTFISAPVTSGNHRGLLPGVLTVSWAKSLETKSVSIYRIHVRIYIGSLLLLGGIWRIYCRYHRQVRVDRWRSRNAKRANRLSCLWSFSVVLFWSCSQPAWVIGSFRFRWHRFVWFWCGWNSCFVLKPVPVKWNLHKVSFVVGILLGSSKDRSDPTAGDTVNLSLSYPGVVTIIATLGVLWASRRVASPSIEIPIHFWKKKFADKLHKSYKKHPWQTSPTFSGHFTLQAEPKINWNNYISMVLWACFSNKVCIYQKNKQPKWRLLWSHDPWDLISWFPLPSLGLSPMENPMLKG